MPGGGGGGYENFPKSHPQYLGTKLQCSLPVQGFAVGNNSLLQRAMGGSYTCISSPGSLYLNWPQLPADMPCVQDRQRDDASWPKTWLWALCRHNSCTLIGSIMGVWWLNLRSKGIPVVHSSSPFQQFMVQLRVKNSFLLDQFFSLIATTLGPQCGRGVFDF